MARLFSVPAFRFNATPTVGRWSRIATYGKKLHDGSEMLFDGSSLGQMVDNFAKRGDKLAICQDHLSAYVPITGRPAPALGYFTALALIEKGAVTKFAAVDTAVTKPSPAEMEDGLYACLGEITTLGHDPKEGLSCYAFLSPMFSEAAEAEDGTPIGFALFDVAATNTPFQAGAEIQFHRKAVRNGATRAMGVHGMNEEMMKRFGFADGDDDAAKEAKMTSYFAAVDEKFSKLAKFEAGGDAADDDEEAEKKKLAADLGVPATMSAIRAAAVPLSKFTALQKEVDAIKVARNVELEAAATQKAVTLFERAAKCGYPADQKDGFLTFAKANFTAAEALVNGLPTAKLLTRMTQGGSPVGTGRSETISAAAPESINGAKVMGRSLSEAAKQLVSAGKAKDLASAQVMALRANPSLGEQ